MSASPTSAPLCTEVAPEGDLDGFTLPAFIRAVDAALRTSARVELDLTGVDFMSIAAAAYVWKRVAAPGTAPVEIVAVSTAASRSLVVTGFGGVTEV
ncbi:STAS domain-containing protein [Tsukamurella ocularis]|uniref:STAS domain-containing protein n=1 Tax=Tsukamurella ocularis TaxID=1970234 RepID=UPI0039EF9FF3